MGICLLLFGQSALAQVHATDTSPYTPTELLSPIETPASQITEIRSTSLPKGLPVKLFYYGPPVSGQHSLTVTLSRLDKSLPNTNPQPISESTLHVTELSFETDALVTLPKDIQGLQIKAVVRDVNQNLVLKTTSLAPVLDDSVRHLILTTPNSPENTADIDIPDFTSVETITGKIQLPRNSPSLNGATLHVQLLENALAGGLSIQLAAQDVRPVSIQDGEINFSLQRGLWERQDDPDLAFKAWITDSRGRKVLIMKQPVSYNGPDIEYVLELDLSLIHI